MLARFAARLLLAPLGFTIGVIACFVTLAVISADTLGHPRLLPEEMALLGYDLAVDATMIALLLAPLMAAPAVVAVLISEMFSIRSWTYHAIAGAVSAFAPWSLAPTGVDGAIFTAPQVLAGGVVGGLAHWLIAGRRAGLAPVVAEPAPPPPDRQG